MDFVGQNAVFSPLDIAFLPFICQLVARCDGTNAGINPIFVVAKQAVFLSLSFKWIDLNLIQSAAAGLGLPLFKRFCFGRRDRLHNSQ